MANSSKDIQLIELKGMILQLNTTIKALTETLNKQQAENDNLKAELAWFRQKYFGASGERRVDDIAGQLNLFLQKETHVSRTIQGYPYPTSEGRYTDRGRKSMSYLPNPNGSDWNGSYP